MSWDYDYYSERNYATPNGYNHDDTKNRCWTEEQQCKFLACSLIFRSIQDYQQTVKHIQNPPQSMTLQQAERELIQVTKFIKEDMVPLGHSFRVRINLEYIRDNIDTLPSINDKDVDFYTNLLTE